MKKLLLFLFFFAALKVSAQTYTLNYDSVRVGKAASSGVDIPDRLYLHGLPAGLIAIQADGKVLHNDTVYIKKTDTAGMLSHYINLSQKGAINGVAALDGSGNFASKTTDNLSEGSTNLYFTNARTIGSTLTGYTSGTGTISSSDNVLQAIQKLNGNIALRGTVTSITPGYGFTSSTPITTSGTMIIDTAKIQTVLNFKPLGSTYWLSKTATTLPSSFVNSSLTSAAGGSFGTNAYTSTHIPSIGGANYIQQSDGTNLINSTIYSSSGKTGINTTAPINFFDAKVTTNKHFQLSSSSFGTGISVYAGSDADAYNILQLDGSILSLNSRSGGFVGIGYTADPTSGNAFGVNGNSYTSGSSIANGFKIPGKTSADFVLADGSTTTVSGSVYKGQLDGSTGMPIGGGSALADGTGTTGWYYACSVGGSYNYGGGSITLAIGDQLYYNGTIWLKIPGAGSYTLPIATASVLGGIKPDGTTITNASGAISVAYGTSSNTAAQGNDSRITGALSAAATTLPSSFTASYLTSAAGGSFGSYAYRSSGLAELSGDGFTGKLKVVAPSSGTNLLAFGTASTDFFKYTYDDAAGALNITTDGTQRPINFSNGFLNLIAPTSGTTQLSFGTAGVKYFKWTYDDATGSLTLTNDGSPRTLNLNNGPVSISDAVSASNLSGTNTGDNAPNTTSNAYADAKVQNSLSASTTIAPSATAVNTALSGKQASITTGTTAQYIDGTLALQTFPTSLAPSGSAGGDLTGTYPNPTVNTINSITKSYYDPTSSIQTQLNGKQASLGYTAEDVANKSTSTSLGTSNTLYPTQNAVKTYVDAAVGGTGAYSEGSWIPTCSTSLGSATGRYTKIGNMVFARFVVFVNTNSDGSSFTIAGLPFTNSTYGGGSVIISEGSSTSMTALVSTSGTTITFRAGTSDAINSQLSGVYVSGEAIYNTTN